MTAVEPGAELAAIARRRIATFRNVEVETSTFGEWDDHGRRFDVLVAASSWQWVDPLMGWQRAHEVVYPGGWMALLGNVVVRRPGEPEVYAETADLHERFSPGNPGWGHPPLEDVDSRVPARPPPRCGWPNCSSRRSAASRHRSRAYYWVSVEDEVRMTNEGWGLGPVVLTEDGRI